MEARSLLELDPSLLEPWNGTWVAQLKGSNAQFIEFSVANKPFILRLTAATHREKEAILAEIDWIHHLRNSGISVCVPVPTHENFLLQEFTRDSRKYWGVAFTKASGKKASYHPYESGFVRKWGATVAKMHDASTRYTDPLMIRSKWNSEILLEHAVKHLDNTTVIHQMKHAADILSQLPESPDSFGIIHSDIVPGNFRISDQGDLCLFDFDDSQYNHFVYDFVIILFMVLFHVKADNSRFSVPEFYTEWLSGYREIRDFSAASLTVIPEFLTFFNGLVAVSLKQRGITDTHSELYRFVIDNITTGFPPKRFRPHSSEILTI